MLVDRSFLQNFSFVLIYGIYIPFIFASQCQVPTEPVHSYKQPGGSFFMTQNENELGIRLGRLSWNYIYVGSSFRMPPAQSKARLDPQMWAPVYRYFNGKVHFYTTDPQEIGATHAEGAVGKHGYRYEGILGFVGRFEFPGSLALHRFYLPAQRHAHQYVMETDSDYYMNRADPAVHYEGIIGYVYPNF